MLGPESHVYDPLPSSTSIRVLLLAPGQPEDDIFCYLFPCDLDRDHTIDPSAPRPFENLCVAEARGIDSRNETKRFGLHIDSYIDDSEKTVAPHTEEASELPAETADQSEADNTDSSPKNLNEEAGHDAASDTYKRVVEFASGFLENNKTDNDDSQEQLDENHELSDDWWDMLQLTRLTMANGALDSRVHRHPFQRYTALSDVWGSVEDPACITMDGQTRFWVTKNLFDALKCLRQTDVAQALWVDAICINQNDPVEKRVQIGLMRRVYRQAQKVIAYVPQTKEDTESFTKLVGRILQVDAQCRKVIASGSAAERQDNLEDSDVRQQAESGQREESSTSTSDVPERQVKLLPLKPTGTCIEDYDVPPEDDALWGAWRRFFASPYFRRIWILQEYALAQELYFQLGSWQGNADIILLVMDSINRRSRLMNAHYLGRGENAELTRAAVLGWRGLEEMTMERVFTQRHLHDEASLRLIGLRSRLVDKLYKTMNFDATDPRDKIYALLGLVSDAEKFADLVSYQTSDTYPKIYRRFAQALVKQGHVMQVLQMACRTPMSPQLPSWVPDWSGPTTISPVATVSLERGFQAGGNEGVISTHFPQQNPDQLILSGQIFSTITFKTSTLDSYSLNASLGGRLQDFFEMLSAALSELSTYLAQQPGALIMDIFYILTMQLRKFKPTDRDQPSNLEAVNDLRLFRTLIVRIMNYSQIENHAQHKVVFGAFPEEDLTFMQRVMGNLSGRSFCITSVDNRIGLVPERAQIGDSLAIVDGAPVPFVLRYATGSAAGSGEAYSIIGDAYVTGIMQGELIQNGEHPWRQITLV